jgi:hypothetical protein
MIRHKPGRGLDLGTSYVIVGRTLKGGRINYTEMRDCFFELMPKTRISRQIMIKGLEGQKYFQDGDKFIVIGQDAIERAIERHESTFRPMERGVLSPKERRARSILRFILKYILGEPVEPNERIIYSVPSQPIDMLANQFDIAFHQDAISNDLQDLGFAPSAIPEAEAVCYSELRDENYTGIGMSWGAGMVNVNLMSSGESVIHWSTTQSGDWIDRMAAISSDVPDTVVQVEKEQGEFVVGEEVPGDPLLSSIAIYYKRLIDYTVKLMIKQLTRAGKMPKLLRPVPIVLAGGTAQAKGFKEAFERSWEKNLNGELPFSIKEVRLAKDPLRAISRGCLLASELA